MDNKRKKLFVIKQSEERKFMPKMQQNVFGGRALPGPAGGVYALPRLPSRNGGLLVRGCMEPEAWERKGPHTRTRLTALCPGLPG